VVLFCENNLYSEMTPIRDTVATRQITDRAVGYGMRAVRVDGYDPIATYEATLDAVERARRGEGPTFIEAMTYRLVGHMIGDNEVYRTKAEVAEWRERDMIDTFPQRLVAEFGVTPERIAAVEADVAHEMAEIVRFAEESPWPEPSEVTEDVWA
jgi:pyruvate dehydrogenase E1 component alpha subunit